VVSKADQQGKHRWMQFLVFVFSLIFFGFVAYGWFYLVLGLGTFVALVLCIIIALIAWAFARTIGEDHRKYWPLFIPLFMLSAIGVYNSLMLHTEGDQIITDAAVEAQTQFAVLNRAAEEKLAQSGATARVNRIKSSSDSLFSEIANENNCGQGPKARQLIADLQRELPGFTALSVGARPCERNEELIADYRKRIDALVERAEWNTADLNAVRTQSATALGALEQLRSGATTNYNPMMLQRTLNEFQSLDGVYRNLRLTLAKHADVRDIPGGLHLSEVESLGNVGKVVALIIERLDEPITPVYLLLAFGFDLLMVYLFSLAAANRVKRPVLDDRFPGGI
jgi:hypothetical protein